MAYKSIGSLSSRQGEPKCRLSPKEAMKNNTFPVNKKMKKIKWRRKNRR
jgi:hypothetical protein